MLNKKILEKKVNVAMKKAYVKSFKGGVLDNDMMKSIRAAAKYFADTAAPALADAIEEYVKSGDIILPNAGTQTFTVTATGAMGPVTGTAIGPVAGKINLV